MHRLLSQGSTRLPLRRSFSANCFVEDVKSRIEKENRILAGAKDKSCALGMRILRCKNSYDDETINGRVPAAEREYVTSNKSALLGDAYEHLHLMTEWLACEAPYLTDDSIIEQYGLLSGYDDKYTNTWSSINFNYGTGLLCWNHDNNDIISARLNKHWYLLNETALLPQGIGIVKETQKEVDNYNYNDDDQHGDQDSLNITNLTQMTKREFVSKMKQFDKENWTCLFKINNIPYDCTNALSKTFNDKQANVCVERLTDIFNDYHNNNNNNNDLVGSQFCQLSNNFNINLICDSPIYHLANILLQLLHDNDNNLLQCLFLANATLFDENFQSAIIEIDDNFRDISQIGQLILDKIGDLNSININVPFELKHEFDKHFEYCQNYRLPIMVNKEWLLLVLGFRGLEKKHDCLFDDTIADSMVQSSKELELLYDKFLNITSDMIDVLTPDKKIDGTQVFALDNTINCIEHLVINPNYNLSTNEQQKVASIMRHAMRLNQLCDFIFSMKDDGSDDTCKIQFDKIFSDDDIKTLKHGVSVGLETAFDQLKNIDIYYGQFDQTFSSIKDDFKLKLNLHHQKYNNLGDEYMLY